MLHYCLQCLPSSLSLMMQRAAGQPQPSLPPILLSSHLQVEKACLPALRELGFDEDHIIVF